MGIITACSALGSVVSPLLFNVLLRSYGFAGAMKGLALCLVFITPITYAFLAKSNTKIQLLVDVKGDVDSPHRLLIIKLWISYGTAVAAGLIAIGHATGIARANELSDWWVLLAPVIIASFNMIGSLIGGTLADKLPIRYVLVLIPAFSCAALFMLAVFEGA